MRLDRLPGGVVPICGMTIAVPSGGLDGTIERQWVLTTTETSLSLMRMAHAKKKDKEFVNSKHQYKALVSEHNKQNPKI